MAGSIRKYDLDGNLVDESGDLESVRDTRGYTKYGDWHYYVRAYDSDSWWIYELRRLHDDNFAAGHSASEHLALLGDDLDYWADRYSLAHTADDNIWVLGVSTRELRRFNDSTGERLETQHLNYDEEDLGWSVRVGVATMICACGNTVAIASDVNYEGGSS